ncbi:MAG: TrpR-like protein YerC/YecD [Clostridia bacterium]|nr:TrpR-like protein YerC/YecD [Clostridia bacterium]
MAKSSDFKNFYKAVLSLGNEKECEIFFKDICTMKELETMSQRLEVAKMLLEGKTFNEIVSATGASTTTISRVNRCLNYGDGGYKAVIEK